MKNWAALGRFKKTQNSKTASAANRRTPPGDIPPQDISCPKPPRRSKIIPIGVTAPHHAHGCPLGLLDLLALPREP